MSEKSFLFSPFKVGLFPGLLGPSRSEVASQVASDPDAHGLFSGLRSSPSLAGEVSRYDLPDAEAYREFFLRGQDGGLESFPTIRETCGGMFGGGKGGCPLDRLVSQKIVFQEKRYFKHN